MNDGSSNAEQRHFRVAHDRNGMLTAQWHLREGSGYARGDVVGFLTFMSAEDDLEYPLSIDGDAIGYLTFTPPHNADDGSIERRIAVIPATVVDSWQGEIDVEIETEVPDDTYRSRIVRYNKLKVDAEGYGDRVIPLHDLEPAQLDQVLGSLARIKFGKLAPDDPQVLEQVEIELERLRRQRSRLHV